MKIMIVMIAGLNKKKKQDEVRWEDDIREEKWVKETIIFIMIEVIEDHKMKNKHHLQVLN